MLVFKLEIPSMNILSCVELKTELHGVTVRFTIEPNHTGKVNHCILTVHLESVKYVCCTDLKKNP